MCEERGGALSLDVWVYYPVGSVYTFHLKIGMGSVIRRGDLVCVGLGEQPEGK